MTDCRFPLDLKGQTAAHLNCSKLLDRIPAIVWTLFRLVMKLIVSPRYKPELDPVTLTRNSSERSANVNFGSTTRSTALDDSDSCPSAPVHAGAHRRYSKLLPAYHNMCHTHAHETTEPSERMNTIRSTWLPTRPPTASTFGLVFVGLSAPLA